jgi:hypothetical protein
MVNHSVIMKEDFPDLQPKSKRERPHNLGALLSKSMLGGTNSLPPRSPFTQREGYSSGSHNKSKVNMSLPNI